MDYSHEEHNEESRGGNSILRWILIIGMLIILFFISIGIVKFVPKALSTASTYLSSVFSFKPKLDISFDKKSVNSEEPFLISWKNNTEEKSGSYSLGYKCEQGIRVYEMREGKPVVCETPFPIGTNEGSLPVKIISDKNEKVDVAFNVSFNKMGSSDISLSNSESIDVTPKNFGAVSDSNSSSNNYGNVSTSTSQSKQNSQNPNTSTTNSDQNRNTYYPAGTKSDLSISLVKRGIVDINDNFREGNIINSGDRAMIQFKISNDGTAPSGAWTLKATIPSANPSEKNITRVQPSLRPGASYILTLRFDSFDPYSPNAIISIESSSDSNTSNNQITIPFDGSYYGGNNYYGNNYYSGTAPDLVARIVSIDRTGGYYYGNNYYGNNYTNKTLVVRFEIQNIGGSATGPWRFRADLPSYDNNVYNSPLKSSLAPGATSSFTLTVTNANNGGIVRITADSDYQVNEQNEYNNTDESGVYGYSY